MTPTDRDRELAVELVDRWLDDWKQDYGKSREETAAGLEAWLALFRAQARQEGREEVAALLSRLYKAIHRQGWEPGESEGEVLDQVVDLLANLGMDPNLDPPGRREDPMSGPEVCSHLVPADRECDECARENKSGQLQAALYRAAQAEAREVELRGALKGLRREAIVLSDSAMKSLVEGQSDDYTVYGWSARSWRRVKDAAKAADQALASPSPVAKALGRVVEALEIQYESPHLASHLCEECEVDPIVLEALGAHEQTMVLYRALQAARAGRGEGEGEG